MSLLSRVLAPHARNDLADLVSALLAAPASPAPARLAAPPAPPDPPRRLPGPRGLGVSATRIIRAATPATAAAPGALMTAPPVTGRPAGLVAPPGQVAETPHPEESPVPELYCPPAIRDDPVLGEIVNERLVDWAVSIGIYPGQIDRLRSANFGRLMMLTHPECNDPDRLLAAAKCVLAEWAVDDHYVDGEAGDLPPQLLGQRLAIAYSAIDPVHLPVDYVPQLEQVTRDDPVMLALRSGLDDLARYGTAAQTARLRHELAVMFVAYNQEGVWRATGTTPPVWEYLLHRSENSFLPPMALIDVMGGYELPPGEFAEPAVRKAFMLAGTASVVLNDLYSMTKEDPTDTNLPRVIAAERQCSLKDAVNRTAAIHDELMHRFEAEALALIGTGSPMLFRFLAGLWAWLGGSREWHRTTERYQPKTSK